MYLFSRNVVVSGDPRKVLPIAVGMAEMVNKKTDVKTSLWINILGEPLGTLVYTSFLQSLAELDAANSALMADNEYLDGLGEAMQYVVGQPVDRMLEILHNAGGEYRRAEVGAVANLVQAQVSNARFGAALKWSVEMADLAAEITGRPGVFGRSISGSFGEVAWISSAPDMPAVDASNDALGKDARYLAKLDEMGDNFLPGSGRTSLARRIA